MAASTHLHLSCEVKSTVMRYMNNTLLRIGVLSYNTDLSPYLRH